MKNTVNIYIDNLTYTSRFNRLIWAIAYLFFFRYTPRLFFYKWRVILLKLFGAKIGLGCKIAPTCKIWAPWNLEMGDDVCLGGDSNIYTVDKIILGSHITISQGAFICTGSHDISYLSRPLIHKPITIDDYTWICAESFISPGVEIKKGAVVAARAVVTKNVDAWIVVAGNPAKPIKNREIIE